LQGLRTTQEMGGAARVSAAEWVEKRIAAGI
jgi:hypothetical protein